MTNRIFLLAAAAAGLMGIELWRSGMPFAALALLIGVCFLFAAVSVKDRQEAYADTYSRRKEARDTDPFPGIVETQGWTAMPDLDESTVRLLHAAVQTLHRMRGIADRLEDDKVVRIIRELCATGDAILDKIRRHPGRLASVRRFFDYHLPATGSILDKYDAFLHSEVYTNEMEYQVMQMEKLLERIRRHFLKQLQRLMQDDLLDAEIEVNAYERVMRSESR